MDLKVLEDLNEAVGVAEDMLLDVAEPLDYAEELLGLSGALA